MYKCFSFKRWQFELTRLWIAVIFISINMLFLFCFVKISLSLPRYFKQLNQVSNVMFACLSRPHSHYLISDFWGVCLCCNDTYFMLSKPPESLFRGFLKKENVFWVMIFFTFNFWFLNFSGNRLNGMEKEKKMKNED